MPKMFLKILKYKFYQILADVMHTDLIGFLLHKGFGGGEIGVVGINKVKVRPLYLCVANVLHFFRTRAMGTQAIDTFSIFEHFDILHLPDLFVSLAPLSPSVKEFDLRDGSRADPAEENSSPCPQLSKSLISMFVWGGPPPIL